METFIFSLPPVGSLHELDRPLASRNPLGEIGKFTMVHISDSVLITFLFLSCHDQDKPLQSFEGKLLYQVSVEANTDNLEYNVYQKEKYGDSIIVYQFSDGSFRREYQGTGSNGFEFTIYNASENAYYTKWKNRDTIYKSNASVNSLTLIDQQDVAPIIHKSEKYPGFHISGKDPSGRQNVGLTCYYSIHSQYINPDLYKNTKDFFYDIIIQKIKSPFYKLIMDMQFYKVSMTLLKTEVIMNDRRILLISSTAIVKPI